MRSLGLWLPDGYAFFWKMGSMVTVTFIQIPSNILTSGKRSASRLLAYKSIKHFFRHQDKKAFRIFGRFVNLVEDGIF